ncbi:MAG: CPBP family intramembrane metalloprotease [Clostridia bacterium]|nr:CPBP family intramembrane metalloprotease [Clostridia bacterium]MBQ8333478.1 CPBP family intramembrane metalloprotease [Clostridia bacterium]
MENNSIRRLLHTLFPFVIFVLIHRLLALVIGQLDLIPDPSAAGLCAFLPASLAAVILFRLKTYAPTDEEENNPVAPPAKSHPAHGLLGIVAAVAVMIVAMFLVSVPFTSSQIAVPDGGILSFLSLVVIHPVIEEYIFRGLFYGELRKMNPVFGSVAQCVMFAIIHDTVTGMIYALFSGLVLAYLMENTGRLWVPMAAHAIINLRSWLCLTVLADNPFLCLLLDRFFLIGGFVCFILFLIIRNAPHTAEDTP